MSRNCLRKKQVVLLSIAFIVMALAFITLTQSAYADSSQSYASVSLQYFTVQVQYPPLVVPGESVIIHIQATAKSAVNLNSLTAYAYYADGLNLHQVASATVVASQNVAAGNTFTNDLQLTVPQGVPRTSLFATFTESVKGSYVSSYSYSSNYYGNYKCRYKG